MTNVAQGYGDGTSLDGRALARESGFIGLLPTALLYFSLGLIFLWIGAMKFTAYEAQGIEVFLRNSPATQWLYSSLSAPQVSYLFGVVEILTGLLILSRPFNRTLSALGGAMATIAFLVTVSFLFTTPGVWAAQAGGPPWLSAEIGQFLAKDVVLLAASLAILAESTTRRRVLQGV